MTILSPRERVRERGRKLGFTLAEVLITLGIIGVVAALTLPAFIQKYQEKQWTTAYLRIYSILDNAYKKTVEENGTFENWSGADITLTPEGTKIVSLGDADKIYNTMIKPHVQLAKVSLKTGEGNCMPDKSYRLDGSVEQTGFNHASYTVSLPSGECIIIARVTSGHFFVDLNGKKNPNTLGKDQFYFSFDINNPERIKPGYMQVNWTDTPAYCDVNSAHGWIAGMSRGFWIVRNHNMDYLHMPYDELSQNWGRSGW